MSRDARRSFGFSTGGSISGRVESLGPGKNVLMPDIYAEGHAVKEADLEIVGESPQDINESLADGESAGFNPYDTGVLHIK